MMTTLSQEDNSHDFALSLKFAKFKFVCKLTDECQLPKFKGSTFRGVFGRALQKISCGLQEKNCSSCGIKYNCLYAKVFETQKQDEQENENVVLSHPYIIESLENEKTFFKKDDFLEFNLILFGDFVFDIPYFIYAIIEMGKIGIGKKNKNNERSRFILEEVFLKNFSIYSSKNPIIKNDIVKKYASVLSKDDLLVNKNSGVEKKQVKIILETPLRFKSNNKFYKDDLEFSILIKSIFRRMNSLFKLYGEGILELNNKELISSADKIKIKDSNLLWNDLRRYSLRQESAMFIGGLVGEVVYVGDLENFYPFLKVAEIFHVGKQTSFGLGKIRIE